MSAAQWYVEYRRWPQKFGMGAAQQLLASVVQTPAEASRFPSAEQAETRARMQWGDEGAMNYVVCKFQLHMPQPKTFEDKTKIPAALRDAAKKQGTLL